MFRPNRLLGLVLCALAATSLGENLLKNTDFESYAGKPGEVSDWTVSPGWKRGDISSFQGLPFKMCYLERAGGGTVEQKGIAISAGKWYALESWYKADLTPERGGNFWLYPITLPATGAKPEEKPKQLGLKFGAIPNWVLVKTLFNSGDRQQIDLQARTIGEGQSALGSLVLREMDARDFEGPFLLDPGFEKGVPGKNPLEVLGCEARVTDKECHKGKHSVVLSFNESTGFSVPANIPVRPGDEAEFSFMARTDRPGLLVVPVIERDMDPRDKSRPFLRGRGEAKLGDQWRKVSCSIIIPKTKGEDYFMDGIQLLRCAAVFLNPDKDAKVWIDDLSVAVKREKEDHQPVFGSEKNPLKNSSFEAGLDGWEPRFWQGMADADWPLLYGQALSDDTTAVEGKRSLKMIVPRKKSGPSRASIMGLWFPATEDKPYTVSFWAKAEQPGSIKHYLVEYGGRRTSAVAAIGTEWKRHSATVVPRTTSHGFLYLYMEFDPGTYWLDAVQVESGSKATDYSPPGQLEVGVESDRIYPWYVTGDDAVARVSLCSRLAEARNLTLSWQVKDWQQQVVDSGQRSVTLQGGDTVAQPFKLFSARYGTFVAEVTLKDPQSGVAATSAMVYGIFPKVRNVEAERSSLGIHYPCAHFGVLWLRGGNVNNVLDLFEMLGVRWYADYSVLVWNNIEPQENHWRWPDNFITAVTDRGIKMMPLLTGLMFKRYIPAWALGDEDGIPPDFYDVEDALRKAPRSAALKDYVKAVAEHYGKKIDAYELWGEGGILTPEAFVKTYAAARQGLDELKDPPRLVGPGLPAQGLPYGPNDDTSIGRTFKLGLSKYLDVISAHYYPYPNYGSGIELESITDRYGNREESMRNSVDYVLKTYGQKPLWDSEYGFLGRSQLREWEKPDNYRNFRGMSTAQQARRFVRWRIMGMAAGFKRFFYHTLHDVIATGRGANFHEMSEHTAAPKPIAVAHAQLARRLDDFTFVRKVEITPTIWSYVFKADGKVVGIYWDYRAGAEGGLSLPAQAVNGVAFEDLMGNPFQPGKTPSGACIVPVDESPRYLIATDADQIIGLLEKAMPVGTVPVQIELSLTDGPSLAVGVKNIVKTPVAGEVRIDSLPEGWRAAKDTVSFADALPGQVTVVVAPLAQFNRNVGTFRATCSAGGGAVDASRKLLLAEVQDKGNVVVDGEISAQEYGAAPAITLAQKSQHLPVVDELGKVDPKYPWGGPDDLSGEVLISWRPDALYLGVKVKDNVILNNAPIERLWSQDAIEIYLDTAPTQNMMGRYRYGICQGRLSLAPGTDGKPRFRFEKTPGGLLRDIDQQNITTAYRKTSEGYNIEVKLPLKNATLKSGAVWGFYVDLYDVDREEDRQVKALVWENVGRQYYENPFIWGYLLFR